MIRLAALFLLLAADFAGSAGEAAVMAPGACPGVDTSLTAARKQEYAVLVMKSLTPKVAISGISVHDFMAEGAWSAVYASTPVSEDGVFFYQAAAGRKQFKEVWGGWAEPSDKPELVKWARKLGAPEGLAACFADMVTRH